MSDSDISLEPLLNQSSEGIGTSKKLAFVIVDSVGEASHRIAVAITSTPIEITITSGKKTIEIQNSGVANIYYGGSGVSSSNGITLFRNSSKIFSNVKDTFSVFIVTAPATTSEIRIVEYD